MFVELIIIVFVWIEHNYFLAIHFFSKGTMGNDSYIVGVYPARYGRRRVEQDWCRDHFSNPRMISMGPVPQEMMQALEADAKAAREAKPTRRKATIKVLGCDETSKHGSNSFYKTHCYFGKSERAYVDAVATSVYRQVDAPEVLELHLMCDCGMLWMIHVSGGAESPVVRLFQRPARELFDLVVRQRTMTEVWHGRRGTGCDLLSRYEDMINDKEYRAVWMNEGMEEWTELPVPTQDACVIQ